MFVMMRLLFSLFICYMQTVHLTPRFLIDFHGIRMRPCASHILAKPLQNAGNFLRALWSVPSYLLWRKPLTCPDYPWSCRVWSSDWFVSSKREWGLSTQHLICYNCSMCLLMSRSERELNCSNVALSHSGVCCPGLAFTYQVDRQLPMC